MEDGEVEEENTVYGEKADGVASPISQKKGSRKWEYIYNKNYKSLTTTN